MLKELFEAAASAGLGLTLLRRTRELRISFSRGSSPKEAAAALYPLLAAVEDGLLVTISGAPPCLMPDAFEHFTWPLGARAPFRRAAACRGCALKDRCPGISPALLGRFSPVPVLPVPAEIVLELNKRCNLSCRACFGRTGEELPYARAGKALREAAKLGVRNARLTGGEPLLYPGLGRLLRLAKKLGFYTLLNTNAVLFTAAKAKEFRGLIDNALVSLPGADEASHAAGCGRPGALRLKKDAVKRFRAAGSGLVRAGSVISKGLIKDFSRWHAAVGRMGFDIWELYRPMMAEKALAGAPEFRISRKDIVSLARKLAAQSGDTRAVLANPVPFCALPAAARPFALGARFDDGRTRLVLDASGSYKPGYPSRKFLGGGLAKAWTSRFLRKTRGSAGLPRACRACRMLCVCLGGSRFQAEAAGDIFGPDPWMKE